MKKNVINAIVFIISVACFAIRSKLIYNTGIFCDEFGTSPDIIYGGNFYLMLDWAEWALLALIIIIFLISFIVNLIKRLKK